MALTWHATATLTDTVAFEATADSGHTIRLDSAEVPGGGNSGFRPLELLLVAAGGCGGMFITSILRRRQQVVDAYKVEVTATRAEAHPLVFTEMTIEHQLTGRGLSSEVVKSTIALAFEKYCPVLLMLGQPIPTVHRYRILDAETGAEESGVVEPTA